MLVRGGTFRNTDVDGSSGLMRPVSVKSTSSGTLGLNVYLTVFLKTNEMTFSCC